MDLITRHSRVRSFGAALCVLGVVLVALAAFVPRAGADTAPHVFEGDCVGTALSGVCVLDEPEGNNPAVHGLASYTRTPTTMIFAIEPDDRVTEVQICMQTSGPFPVGANVCAGTHGDHVSFDKVGNVYTVDLVSEGLATASPLYWTIHVVAGGRTLQVVGATSAPLPTTTSTTTNPSSTTTSITTSSTTTPATTTSSTTTPSTTTSPTTTPSSTSSSSTSSPTSTSSSTSSSTPSSTTTTLAGATTSSSVAAATTTTTSPVRVLGKDLARTGGPRWWALLGGTALLLIGATMLLMANVLHPRHHAG